MFGKNKPYKNQRKKIFINKEIQGKILWRCVAFWAIYHFIMLHTLFAFEFMAYLVSIMNGGSPQSFSDIYTTFLGKYYPIILTALSLLPFLTLDLIKMSHRIVGPFVPFQRAFKDLKAGKRVERIQLREGDLLTEFQTDFNEFLQWYNEEKLGSPAKDNSSATESKEGQLEDSIIAEVESLQADASAMTNHDDSTPAAEQTQST